MSGIQKNVMNSFCKVQNNYKFLYLLGERTHQIPIEGLAKKEDTYRKIWLDLLRFVNPEQTAIFPPIYCWVCKINVNH